MLRHGGIRLRVLCGLTAGCLLLAGCGEAPPTQTPVVIVVTAAPVVIIVTAIPVPSTATAIVPMAVPPTSAPPPSTPASALPTLTLNAHEATVAAKQQAFADYLTAVEKTPLPTVTPEPTLPDGMLSESAWRDAITQQNDQLIAVHRDITQDSKATDMFSTAWRERMMGSARQLQAIADVALAWQAPPYYQALDATWKEGMRHLALEASLLKQGIADNDNYALLAAIREGDQGEPKILSVLLQLVNQR